MTIQRSAASQVRSLIAEIVQLRLKISPAEPPFERRSHRDRDIIEIAHALNVHVAWHEAAGDDYQPACICGWRGEVSDDLVARAMEIIDHTMSKENSEH